MISKVTVNDFQSIEHAELDFGGQGSITTIVGPSSTGKSALLRALHLLMRNASSVPIRAQSKKSQTKISAQVDDKVVAVLRGKSLSTYKIDDIEYSKSGVTVPEKVQEILNLYSASPDLHFSFQFDKPYLLDESGSTISTTLGSLTQANVLRNAAKEGNRRALETKRFITTRQNDVENLKNRLNTEFDSLERDKSIYDEAAKAHQDALEASQTVSQVSQAATDAQDATRALEEATQTREGIKDASDIILDTQQQITKIEQIVLCLEDINTSKDVFTNAPKIKDAQSEISLAAESIHKLEELSQCVADLKSNIDSFNLTKITYTQAVGALELASEQVRVLESQLPRCETCGQVLQHE